MLLEYEDAQSQTRAVILSKEELPSNGKRIALDSEEQPQILRTILQPWQDGNKPGRMKVHCRRQ